MRISVRSPLALLVLLFVFASCSSSSLDTAQPQSHGVTVVVAGQPRPAPTAVVQRVLIPRPTPTAQAVPTPTPTHRSFPAIGVADAVPIELWYPKDPESYEDFSAMVPVERSLYAGTNANREQRIKAVLDWWAFGPDPLEASQGFLDPLASYVDRRCGLVPFRFEFVGRDLIVEFCGQVQTAGVGEDARLLESFHQTLGAAGIERAALVHNGGQRCFGNQNDDDPLACLDGAIADAVGPGFPCPTDATSDVATITGVDEWVNARFGPSLTAKIGRRFDRDAEVTIYPSTLRSAGGEVHWVQTSPADGDRCLYVAAQFLARHSDD